MRISDDYFTSMPYIDKYKNVNLLHRYQEKIIYNFFVILKALEKTLNKDLSSIQKEMEKIDCNKRFSSSFHHFLVKFESCYSQNDLNSIIEVLKFFSSLKKYELYSESFFIEKFGNDYYDQGIEDLLRSQDDVSIEYGLIPEVNEINNSLFAKFSPFAEEALSIIENVEKNFNNEFTTYISKVKLFEGKVVAGMSGLVTFGTIYLRLPRNNEEYIPFFVEHFVHETSHHHLHLLMGFDKLILNDDSERYPAPIRKDIRPLYGIYHATFVLSRIVRVLGVLSSDRSFEIFYEKAKKQFYQGLETLDKHAEMTDLGRQIFNSFESTSNLK